MTLHAYLRLRGTSQGAIEGSVNQAGHEGSILVMSCSHELISPRDASSGLPTGKRQHKPITISKEVDKSSPLLARAWANNENIQEWQLRFWKPLARGRSINFYTIRLSNANISRLHTEMVNGELRESLSFVYQAISWTLESGGISCHDEWAAPVA